MLLVLLVPFLDISHKTIMHLQWFFCFNNKIQRGETELLNLFKMHALKRIDCAKARKITWRKLHHAMEQLWGRLFEWYNLSYMPHSFFVHNNLSVTCPLLSKESLNLFHKNEFWWKTVAVLPLKDQAHLFFPAHNKTVVFAHFWNHEWTIFQNQYTTAQCTLLYCCTQSTTFIIRIVSAKTA